MQVVGRNARALAAPARSRQDAVFPPLSLPQPSPIRVHTGAAAP